MVHYYESRRHRLNPSETPLVRGLVLEKLRRLYDERCDMWLAEEFYRIIWRMDHNRPGRPSYPEPFTWGTLEAYLMGCEEVEP